MSKRQRNGTCYFVPLQNQKWDAMTPFERAQVTLHILDPLHQFLVTSIVSMIWEFTQQSVYEAYDNVCLEARQGPYHGFYPNTEEPLAYFNYVNLIDPELMKDKDGNVDEVMFTTDRFKTTVKARIMQGTWSWQECKRIPSKPTYCLKSISDNESPPDYICKSAQHPCCLKMIRDGDRMLALFLNELLMFENEELFVRLSVPTEISEKECGRVYFHDVLLYPNDHGTNDLIVIFYSRFRFRALIKYLEFSKYTKKIFAFLLVMHPLHFAFAHACCTHSVRPLSMNSTSMTDAHLSISL